MEHLLCVVLKVGYTAPKKNVDPNLRELLVICSLQQTFFDNQLYSRPLLKEQKKTMSSFLGLRSSEDPELHCVIKQRMSCDKTNGLKVRDHHRDGSDQLCPKSILPEKIIWELSLNERVKVNQVNDELTNIPVSGNSRHKCRGVWRREECWETRERFMRLENRGRLRVVVKRALWLAEKDGLYFCTILNTRHIIFVPQFPHL